MSALQGADELVAAQLILEFFREMAEKLEVKYSILWGCIRPARFRVRYFNSGDLLPNNPQTDATMGSVFIIEESGWYPPVRYHLEYLYRLVFESGTWVPYLHCTFNRADWDDTPEMQSATMVKNTKAELPDFLLEEMRKFLRVTFGCGRLAIFGTDDANQFL